MCKIDFSTIEKAIFTGDEIIKILFGGDPWRDWQLTEKLRDICKANKLKYEWNLPKRFLDPATITFKKIK